jgi:hypothetical protein
MNAVAGEDATVLGPWRYPVENSSFYRTAASSMLEQTWQNIKNLRESETQVVAG